MDRGVTGGEEETGERDQAWCVVYSKQIEQQLATTLGGNPNRGRVLGVGCQGGLF